MVAKKTDSIEELSPARRVRTILNRDYSGESVVVKRIHPIFSEMSEFSFENSVDGVWNEISRWVKFEEGVEDGGCRWSKPFVGTVSLHALFELRSRLLTGTFLLDVSVSSVPELVESIVQDWFENHQLTHDQKEMAKKILLRPHRHLYELVAESSLLPSSTATQHTAKCRNAKLDPCDDTNCKMLRKKKRNLAFQKKIPPAAEVANILVAEVDFLEKPVSAFVRLAQAQMLGNFAEVALPTRFVFVLFCPLGDLVSYREIGRVVGNLMTDEIFHSLAYRANSCDHIMAGIDEFMDAAAVLPPSEWDTTIRIEPPAELPSQELRKNPDLPRKQKEDPDIEEFQHLQKMGLVRTGRLFGGLIDDVKRKAKWYWSDFTDGASIQCLASIAFLYFASLSPIITFGGLLGDATENHLAALESLCAGCICGLIYSLLSGQPLALLNATGPVLVFESILYSFCKNNGFDYLSLRLWVGIWIGIFLILLCAFEISAWVAYITRFTEENFALLIATIYIYKAIEKVLDIADDYPLHPPEYNASFCHYFLDDNSTVIPVNETSRFNMIEVLSNNTSEMITAIGKDCLPPVRHENVFLMSVLLSLVTFICCVTLKAMKMTPYFSYKIRSIFSDFAVIIAIGLMTTFDYFAGIETPKLHVPSEFKPTYEGRGWLIHPIHPNNPWWTIPGSMLPAMVATILLFLDQQITAVIVNRQENLLKKGGGYHLDLFVLAIITTLMGFLGLPWHVAGTVLCINHVNSLKKSADSAAPGGKHVFLGVVEQRLTHFFIALLIGVSVFMTPYLGHIPMPVLYGVFLYMGTSTLDDIHFFQRLRILFIPPKYQPDFEYLRAVPLKRVHMFTFVQLICFVVLWVVKGNKTISIAFPLMLVVIIFVRKLLDYVFTKSELRALDTVIPPFRQKKMLPLEGKSDSDNNDNGKGNFPKTKSKSTVNITDEMLTTGTWKHVNATVGKAQEGRAGILDKISQLGGAISKEEYKAIPYADADPDTESRRSSHWSWNI